MTKKEVQEELIRWLKSCDEVQGRYTEDCDEWIFGEGRKSGLKLALQLVEHLEEGKKA